MEETIRGVYYADTLDKFDADLKTRTKVTFNELRYELIPDPLHSSDLRLIIYFKI